MHNAIQCRDMDNFRPSLLDGVGYRYGVIRTKTAAQEYSSVSELTHPAAYQTDHRRKADN